jgi:hypothetical protein
MPASLADPDAVQAHLLANPPTSIFWVGVWMAACGLVALVLLGARIAARIRDAEPTGWLPSVPVGLAIAALAVKLASFAPALAALHADRYDAGTLTPLLDINDAAYDISWALDGAFVLILGLGASATRALPRWLALLGAAGGTAVLIGIAMPSMYESLQMAFLIWTLASSGRPVPAAAPLPAAA